MNDRLVWLDLEMTGLDPETDVVLEVAALVTDGELNEVGEGVDLVVQAPESALARMVPVVVDMHAKSGLTEAVRASSVTLEQAEDAVLALLQEHVGEPGKAPLCGNSIATDRSFVIKHMPRLEAYLHYRMVDVSSIKELARRWYPRAYFHAPKKAGGHRALVDVRESVEELRWYRSTLFVAPDALVIPEVAPAPDATGPSGEATAPTTPPDASATNPAS